MLNPSSFHKEYPSKIVMVYNDRMEYANLNTKGRKHFLEDIRSIDEDFVRTVKEMYSNVESLNTRLHGEIPKNLLYFSYDNSSVKLIWYNKKQIRSVYSDEKEMKLLIPKTIYFFNGELNIFTCSDNIPSINSKLYKLILPNTYSDGSICWGNVKLPEHNNTFEEFMLAWEKRYWNSDFTHSHIEDSKRINNLCYEINKKEDLIHDSINDLL